MKFIAPSHIFANKKQIASIAVLSVMVFGFVTALLLHPAYAAAPALVQQNGGHNSATSTTWNVAFISNTVAGNTLAVLVTSRNCCGSPTQTNPQLTGVTDTQTNTWILQAIVSHSSYDGTNNNWGAEIWTTSAKSSAADTVTFVVNVGPLQSSSDNAWVTEWSGVNPTALAIAGGARTTGGATATITTNSSLSFVSNTVEMAVAAGGNFGTVTPGTGYTLFTAISGGIKQGEYSLAATTSPTNFQFQNGGSATDYAEVGIILGSSSVTTTVGSLQVGSCPTKNTATTTLANSTVYYYEGVTLGSTTVVNLNTFIASTTLSGATTNTLYLVLYVGTAGVSTVSQTTPLVSTAATFFTIVKGEVNQPLSYSVQNSNIPANTAYAVAIEGTDKMAINQSSLSGMFSVAGAVPPHTIITQTTNAAKLYLCMNVNYQVVVTSTVTTTSTLTAPTTIVGTVTSTVLTTVTSIDVNVATTTTTGYVLLLFVLLAPAMILMLAVGSITRNAPTAMIAFVAGLMIGAGIGNVAGIVPFWLVALLVITAIFVIVGIWRSSGAGNG